MKFIFSLMILFNLAFSDMITSPTFMFIPGNIFYHSEHEQNKDKEYNNCNQESIQEPSESDKIMICLTSICAAIVILIGLEV